jgi:hypothetical protein
MYRRMRAFAFSLIVVLVAAAACGGGGDSPTTACGGGDPAAAGCGGGDAGDQPPASGASGGPVHAPPKFTLERGAHLRVVAEARLAPGLLDAGAPGATDDASRLRDSIADLVRVLKQVSDANVELVGEDARVEAGELAVYVGTPARRVFGADVGHAPYDQGFRLVVEPRRIGLAGEGDLATSYAIYELLDRIGCRWFFPGPLGEVLPDTGPVRIPVTDERLAPSTQYRDVWYADDVWRRRNRTGGVEPAVGQTLENDYVTPDEIAKHPEWMATHDGKPVPNRFRWSDAALANLIADRIVTHHAKDGLPSYTLSPTDGDVFDDSAADRALDAGDLDPQTGKVSLTDRYLVFANRIANRVAATYPDLLLGFFAYVEYTRAPVREPVHPMLTPVIAPITFPRAHPMSDDRAPGASELRGIIDGWSKKARAIGMYAYGYYLGEPTAPNPMLTKWAFDVPYALSHGCVYWMPETLPNFETSMHALYMGTRLAFDARLSPEVVYGDIDRRLYGHAAREMHAYWQEVDRVWVQTPEYAGGHFAHGRRFTAEVMGRLRAKLDLAKAAAEGPIERDRVGIADSSLALFEDFMAMRRDFNEGRFADLDARTAAWKKRAGELAVAHKREYAFSWTPWAPGGVPAHYFDVFDRPRYDEAARIARTRSIVATVREFLFAKADSATDLGPNATAFDASSWRRTDVTVDSWSSLGLHGYFGSAWYRATFDVPKGAASTPFQVWVGGTDGRIRVFVDGKEAKFVATSSATAPEGYATPFTFDAGRLSSGSHVVAILATRTTLNELGTGGVMGPVVVTQ